MKFKETIRIDDEFLIDEENKTFCYKNIGRYVVMPAKNIQSCLTMADVDGLGEEYFTKKDVPEFGTVRFVKDLSAFSKAVLEGGLVLAIQYLDENGKMRRHKKRYLPNDRTPYEIMRRVDKLINSL